MSEKNNSIEEVTLFIQDDDHASAKPRFPVHRLAGRILEECLRQNWDRAVLMVDVLLDQCLEGGYFALSKTVKKLRRALEPEIDEHKIRKYLLRMMWLLARAKREKNHFYLIYNDKMTCQMKKHESQKQQIEPETRLTDTLSHENVPRENSFSSIIQRLSNEATITYMETESESHLKLQPPHAKFSVQNHEVSSQHQHTDIPRPMSERIPKKSPSRDHRTES